MSRFDEKAALKPDGMLVPSCPGFDNEPDAPKTVSEIYDDICIVQHDVASLVDDSFPTKRDGWRQAVSDAYMAVGKAVLALSKLKDENPDIAPVAVEISSDGDAVRQSFMGR